VNNGTLNLNSDGPSAIFSLMMDSYSGSGTANVQLYVTGGGAPDYNWHYVAVPEDGVPVTFFTSIDPYNLLAYDDRRVVSSDFDGWSWWDGAADAPPVLGGGAFNTMSFGRGYNFYHASDATVNFSGMTSLGTTLGTVSLQYSGSTPSNPIYGLNLLGNSLTCSIDWDKVVLNGPVGGTVYYTIGNKWSTYLPGVGGTNGATKDIPPLQGFFVKADNTGGSVDFSAAREHSAQARYKKSLSYEESTSKDEVVYPKVKLELSGNGTSDETIVWFKEGATTGYDQTYDGYKIFSPDADFSQLYSILTGKNYVINGLPLPSDNYTIPLGVKIAQAGNYSLLKKDFTAPDGFEVLLTDKSTNNTVNLKSNDTYSFTSDAGTFTGRFILEIRSLSPVSKVEDPKFFNIYSFRENINIMPVNSLLSGTRGEVKIFDSTGKLVKQVKNVEWYNGSLVQIPFSGSKGFYMVEAVSGAIRHIGKIIIK
jgi:hypothetical protein